MINFHKCMVINMWMTWKSFHHYSNNPPSPQKKSWHHNQKLFHNYLHMEIVIELCWKKTEILLIFFKGQILIVLYLSWEHAIGWFDDWQLFQVLAGVWEMYSYVTTQSRLLTNLPFRQVHINLVMHGVNPGTP